MSEERITIKRITDHKGNDKQDGLHTKRVGRQGHFFREPIVGKSMIIDYEPEELGMLRTSRVQKVTELKSCLKVKTMDSIYYLNKVS